MPRITMRLAVGIALALIVTTFLAGVVATSAALTIELSDGDGCNPGTVSSVNTTATPERVTTLAGNVTECIAEASGEADDADVVLEGPPTRYG